MFLQGCNKLTIVKNMPDHKFRDGECVRHRSGGPRMVVNSYQQDGTVWCTWFKDGVQPTGHAFKEYELESDEANPERAPFS